MNANRRQNCRQIAVCDLRERNENLVILTRRHLGHRLSAPSNGRRQTEHRTGTKYGTRLFAIVFSSGSAGDLISAMTKNCLRKHFPRQKHTQIESKADGRLLFIMAFLLSAPYVAKDRRSGWVPSDEGTFA